MKKIIRKVWLKKTPKQLLITIPIGFGIREGDYVEVKKINGRKSK
jgi:hypothetical protein